MEQPPITEPTPEQQPSVISDVTLEAYVDAQQGDGSTDIASASSVARAVLTIKKHRELRDDDILKIADRLKSVGIPVDKDNIGRQLIFRRKNKERVDQRRLIARRLTIVPHQRPLDTRDHTEKRRHHD